MTKLYKYTAIIIFLFFFACTGKQSQRTNVKENLEMKAMLQGTWMDEDTETPMICIKGDSIHYMVSGTLPVTFRIIEDSLITYGTATTSYHIVKQNEYMLWLQSDMGGIIKMNRAEDSDSINSMDFQIQAEKSEPTKEVIQKDRIELYKDVRYRGYVYIILHKLKLQDRHILTKDSKWTMYITTMSSTFVSMKVKTNCSAKMSTRKISAK